MKSEDLYKAIGEIGEDLLARSEQAAEGTAVENSAAGETQKIPVKKAENPAEERKQAKKPVKLYWFRYAAAAAACILVFAGGAAVLRGWRAGSSAPQEVAEEKAVESASASAEAEEAYEELFEEAAPEAEEETEAAPDEEAMMEDTAPAETTEAAPAAEEAPQQAANGAKDAGTGSSVDEDSWDDEPWERSDSAGAVLVSAALKESEESSLRAAFSEEAKSVLTAFEADSAAAILGEEEGENKLYSPLNLYTAMAMLAHVTCEEAQDELIRALGGDAPLVWNTARAVTETATRNNSSGTSRIANSLWLRSGTSYKLTPLLQMSEWYHASTFSGKMGSPEYNAMLRKWISESTEGLLDEYAGEESFDDLTTLALVSSLYYEAPWMDVFFAGNTRKGIFHSPSGDREADMMGTLAELSYYKGNHYQAVSVPLADGNKVVLLLPAEGMTPETLSKDSAWMEPLMDRSLWENEKLVALEAPRFDISCRLDLQESLTRMGVSAVFRDGNAFDRVLDGENVLTRAEQTTRVITDEEGVTAASYTLEAAAGEGEADPQIIEISFDRPFLFAITNDDGLIWFAGVVNEP